MNTVNFSRFVSEEWTKNVLRSGFIRSAEQISQDSRTTKEQVSMIENSQPKSIYNAIDRNIVNECFYGILRKQWHSKLYELFLSPWIADGKFSYPNDKVRDDWKNLFGIAHNSIKTEYGNTNVIDIEKFKSTKNLIDNNLKFIINNTRDSGNYWHWTFETVPKLIILKDLIDKNKWA